ncbi:MAG: anthranilate synthase component family protein [Sphingobacteriaceae bacterium]|jgi:para-aminobenzoate synthetase component 1|nr:anthranilate synthase component family protein [Sphingobacteriaceae bacterium]
MLSEIRFSINNYPDFKDKALAWASGFQTACYLDSNGYHDPYSAFDLLIGAGESANLLASAGSAFEQLNQFLNDQNKNWILGLLGYDLKNEIESLKSENPDQLQFPNLYFFVPEHLLLVKGSELTILSQFPERMFREIQEQIISVAPPAFSAKIQNQFTEKEYVQTVEKLKEHIARGDIYEINFCQEFFCENASVDPLHLFSELNKISPTPFATFLKFQNRYILSATPERFLSKRGNKLRSHPIKGTARRSADAAEDTLIKEQLKNDAKEQSENVMIVDLVRNDLTKCAVPGTVRVEELFGIYSFEQVHQMISTVVCDVDEKVALTNLIKSAFPMGSMTGAPKLSAMQLIEKYEKTRRGVFSGAIGYFAPGGDFDFNVVIRSLLYNADNKYLSFQVGSAITFESNSKKEYQECLLKAQAILQVLTKKEQV